MNTLKPKIYVACLASDELGKPFGAWIDAAQSPEDLEKEITDLLNASPAPNACQWIIQGKEDFGEIEIESITDVAEISALALFLEEHGAAAAALMGEKDLTIDETRQALTNTYAGEFDCDEDFAKHWFEQLYPEVPSNITDHLNFEDLAENLLEWDYFNIYMDGKEYYFRVE
jgi:antirestriction protein